jgi:hypothetical protein
MFNSANNVGTYNIYNHDDDIISVRFDKSLVENEIIKIEDIRFDIDSDLPDDVFFAWQKDNPELPFRSWIVLGKYIPTYIQNADFFDELDTLTKEIEIKLGNIFLNLEKDEGDSDFNDEENEEDEDKKDDED